MQEWSYLRGGLSTIDRDYGIFNKIHHDIGTHVLHHLFPQVCLSSVVTKLAKASGVFTLQSRLLHTFVDCVFVI